MNFDDRGIFGFDVSFYQDNNETPQQIDFNKMKSYGASFVIVRAGQNLYPDPDFQYNWKNAKSVGLPRSSYWFLDIHSSGKVQAQKYLTVLDGDLGEGLLFVDYEKDLQGAFPVWNEVYNFITELMNNGISKSKIGIYTGYFFWVEHGPLSITQRDWFAQFPLWIAWYTTNPDFVKIPPSWVDCLVWQDGTPSIGLQVGVESKEIDHNKFNGDDVKFKLYFGDSPNIPPGGGMTTLYNADLLSGKVSNVRNAPGLSGTVVATLTGPLTVSIVSEKTIADGYDWYQISNGWIALTSSYTNFRPYSVSTEDKPKKVTVEMESGAVFVFENPVQQ